MTTPITLTPNPITVPQGDDVTVQLGPLVDSTGALVNVTGGTATLVVKSHYMATNASGKTYAATFVGSIATGGYYAQFQVPRADTQTIGTQWGHAWFTSAGSTVSTFYFDEFIVSASASQINAKSAALPIATLPPAGVVARVVATANVAALTGLAVIDGYQTVANDPVLLVGQTTASQNGPWVVAAGAWQRPVDFPTGSTRDSRSVVISAGTVNAGTMWVLRATAPVVVDTTGQTWTLLQLAGVVGGVLSGTLPNPGFAVPVATQAGLDAETTARTNAVTTEQNRALAAEATAVHQTGAETVGGVKTFTSPPVVPAASFPESAVSGLVTDLASAVHQAGAETVAGIKTFNAGTLLDKGTAIFNVKAFGAVGNGIADDTAAINAAITAATPAGGTVFLPTGTYLVSSKVTLPPFVNLIGAGMRASILKSSVAAGFAVQAGNNAAALSYGIEISNLGILLTNTAGSAITLYGVADCTVRNVYIEGVPNTTASVGLQIDGANISAFFVRMAGVHCNHVFVGFRHTTTGTTQPTQVVGENCVAFCDNTVGSIGIDVQTVGGVSCGDGVTYIGGDMESCATGINLGASGTTILAMRFENTRGSSSDLTFGALARNNAVVGGSNCYTITDNAGSSSNQVLGVGKDSSAVTQQPNKLGTSLTVGGPATVGGNLTLTAPAGAASRYSVFDSTTAGQWVMQAGIGSGTLGGSIILRGSSYVGDTGGVVVGLGGTGARKFHVNADGLGGGSDLFTVDASGNTVATGSLTAGPTTVQGNLTLTAPAGATNRVSILDGTTAGQWIMQAGIGSAAFGGSLVLRGSSFAGDPGGVRIGLGGTGPRKFGVNTDGLAGGTDVFTVDQAGNLDITQAGAGLKVAEGANAKQGTATLAGGTVTVANTAVTATSRIFLTSQVDGGTPGFLRVSSRVAGTSFTITSGNPLDTSTVAYEIFEVG